MGRAATQHKAETMINQQIRALVQLGHQCMDPQFTFRLRLTLVEDDVQVHGFQTLFKVIFNYKISALRISIKTDCLGLMVMPAN